MSGREKMEKYRHLIGLIIAINTIVPKFIFNFLWVITASSEGSLPLLIRYFYVKKYAKVCGDNIYIGKYVTIKNIQSLILESNISIHAYVYLDAYGGIDIGKNVSIANHSTLVSFEHTWLDYNKPIKYNQVESRQVKIENDVWIGSGCRILSGVTIHTRSIIAAGAVVNKNVHSNVIVGGIPCKVIKQI